MLQVGYCQLRLHGVLADGSFNPTYVRWHSIVDCRSFRSGTAPQAPADHSVQHPATFFVTNQWTTGVTLQQPTHQIKEYFA